MPRKGENIRKRKDGRWEARYKKGIKENGSIEYISIYGRTYKEVKSKLESAKASQNDCNNTATEKTLFADVIFLWRQSNQIRLKGATDQKYDYLINRHILPELGGLKISQINSSIINSFLNKKLTCGRLNGKGGLSTSYVSSMMIIVNSAINFAVAEQMCPPLRTPIYKPKNTKNELKILSNEEQITLENHVRTYLDSTAIGILITLYTGLRIGEICALSWDDVDLKKKIIHVRHTVARVKSESNTKNSKTKLIIDNPKTNASKRDIPIPSALLEPLINYKSLSISPYVASNTSTFISPRTYEYRYHKILKLCGIAPINYHSLRHTFASRCIAVGVDVKSLSEVLGHGNSVITLNTYVHSSIDLKRNQLEKLISLASL